jgi:hypothetical protein
MHDLFVSYKSEQRDEALRFAEALQSSGWSVWYDRHLLAGDAYYDEIGKALKNAKCVVALWSTLSVSSAEVLREARYALKHRKLVGVTLDDAELPYEFQDLHTIQFRGWNGSRTASPFLELVRSVTAKAGRPAAASADPPGSATTDTAGSFRTGRPGDADEPTCVPAASIGVDARALMHLHHEIMTRTTRTERAPLGTFPGAGTVAPLPALTPAASQRLSRPSTDPNPFARFLNRAVSPAYGRITRVELEAVPRVSGWRSVGAGSRDEKKHIAHNSRVAQSALDSLPADMEAVDYMPPQLRNLPPHLKAPAVTLLVHSLAGMGDRPFEITPDMLRQQYLVTSKEASELAQHLGWQL